MIVSSGHNHSVYCSIIFVLTTPKEEECMSRDFGGCDHGHARLGGMLTLDVVMHIEYML